MHSPQRQDYLLRDGHRQVVAATIASMVSIPCRPVVAGPRRADMPKRKGLANNSPRGLMVGDVGIEPTTPSV